VFSLPSSTQPPSTTRPIKKSAQQDIMKRSMEQVKQAALDNTPTRLLAKTTGFFDNMCGASYLREQVAGEPIELDFNGDENSIMQPAFMWMDIDGRGEEGIKSEGEWTDDEDEDCWSECEVFSRSPARRNKTIECDSSRAPPPHYPTKSPSRSLSTATTVTENSYNTSHSWETAVTRHSISSPNPASGENIYSKSKSMSKSSAPRTISIPSFKLKKHQSSMDFPGRSMSMSETRTDSSLGRMSYVAEAEAFRC
jgi:hypothetical protein